MKKLASFGLILTLLLTSTKAAAQTKNASAQGFSIGADDITRLAAVVVVIALGVTAIIVNNNSNNGSNTVSSSH